jgi:hypothetical protein
VTWRFFASSTNSLLYTGAIKTTNTTVPNEMPAGIHHQRDPLRDANTLPTNAIKTTIFMT